MRPTAKQQWKKLAEHLADALVILLTCNSQNPETVARAKEIARAALHAAGRTP